VSESIKETHVGVEVEEEIEFETFGEDGDDQLGKPFRPNGTRDFPAGFGVVQVRNPIGNPPGIYQYRWGFGGAWITHRIVAGAHHNYQVLANPLFLRNKGQVTLDVIP
jgi:hypothetical protein